MAFARRKFLKTSLIGLLGVGGAASLGYLAMPGYEKILQTILENDLSKLKVKPGAIEQFVAAAIKENTFGHSYAKKEMIRIYNYIANSWLPLPYKYKYDQYRADIVCKFLLSSDFFIHKMDESREISYLRIYNPYKFPCGNPFSNLFYPLGNS